MTAIYAAVPSPSRAGEWDVVDEQGRVVGVYRDDAGLPAQPRAEVLAEHLSFLYSRPGMVPVACPVW